MPYIPPYDRADLAPTSVRTPESAGELNFQISSLIIEYLDSKPELSYRLLNEVIGALECVKMEAYRRVVAKYEDQKKEENGDVYV